MTDETMLLGAFVESFELNLRNRPGTGHELVWADTPLGWLKVKDICSYRGFHDQLALVANQEYGEQLLASDLLSLLKEAVEGRKTYLGYKGGEYTYGPLNDLYLVV